MSWVLPYVLVCLQIWVLACVSPYRNSSSFQAVADVPFQLYVLKSNQRGIFAIADIDGDGKNDIVATGLNSKNSSPINWHRYPDWAEFPIEITSNYNMEIHTADVDNDGDADVLAPEPSQNTLWWWKNPLKEGGNPLLGPWQKNKIGEWPGGHSHDFKVGDINNDGKVDAVVNPNAQTPYYVFVQNNPVDWTLVQVEGNSCLEGTWLGDVDNDNDLDITNGREWIETPADLVNSAWIPHRINDYPHNRNRSCIADINGDGRNDIIVTNAEFGNGPMAWYQAPSDLKNGTWVEHIMVPSADINFHTLQVGDIDLDGHPDILTGTTHYLGKNGGYLMRIFYNTKGDASEWKVQQWKTEKGVWQAVLGDVGSDGDLDIVNSDYDEINVQQELWENLLCDSISINSKGRSSISPNASSLIRICKGWGYNSKVALAKAFADQADLLSFLSIHDALGHVGLAKPIAEINEVWPAPRSSTYQSLIPYFESRQPLFR